VISAPGPCTSPQSYHLSAQPDGTYTFSVRQSDPAGNTGSFATSDYALDRGLPAAPVIISGPGTTANNANPAWAFTGEPGATFECQLERSGSPVFGAGPCTSPQTYDLSAQPDGTYTFSVRQSDAAGNTSSPATSDYALDRSSPAPPAVVSGPGAGGSDPTPTWAFSGEDATFSCELRRGSDVVSTPASCTSPMSYDLSAQPDGTYTLVLVQTDAAGNTSAAAMSDYTLDRSSPPPPPVPPTSGGGDTTPASQAKPGTAGAPSERTTDGTSERLNGSPGPGTEARSSAVAPGSSGEITPTTALPSPPAQTPSQRSPRRPVGQTTDETSALEILAEVAGKTAFPIILVLIVVLFLAVQDRIDRNDPKLALAPVRSEPLDFMDPTSLPIGR
jgi:hypothetical protein